MTIFSEEEIAEFLEANNEEMWILMETLLVQMQKNFKQRLYDISEETETFFEEWI